jgi:hypothetical protein
VLYYRVRNQFVWVKGNHWQDGGLAALRLVSWGVRAQITFRRLIHPTRLAAMVLGVVVGLYLFVHVKPVEIQEVRKDAAQHA